MHERAVQLVLLALVLTGTVAAKQPVHRHHSRSTARSAPEAALPCGNLVAFQVLMDRAGFSSGPIDGQAGPNFRHALAAFQTARNLPANGAPDCESWRALNGEGADDVVTKYTITDDDVNAHYQQRIPKDLLEQAKLPDLGYTSLLERLAERFHTSPALLMQMNNRAELSAGRVISVPGVEPFDPSTKPAPPASAGPVSNVTIVVSRDDSSLRAIGPDGAVMFFAPVTTGSEHDPLPVGDWTVKGVQWRPTFHYNPDLFWDAKPDDTKATIKPGPNNPVGVVWIALSVEHYGLHGTPAPEQVGHTASHGCVRLTNWDAARVASMVKPGTPVQFR